MGRPHDAEQQRIANLRRRAAMLERHARARDPLTGKSTLAVEAGRKGGMVTAYRVGSPSAWGLRMSLKRWHGVELPAEFLGRRAAK
jgi:hypothetical protein